LARAEASLRRLKEILNVIAGNLARQMTISQLCREG
jgi:hypothetical protein